MPLCVFISGTSSVTFHYRIVMTRCNYCPQRKVPEHLSKGAIWLKSHFSADFESQHKIDDKIQGLSDKDKYHHLLANLKPSQEIMRKEEGASFDLGDNQHRRHNI